jgi:hypothetical protein
MLPILDLWRAAEERSQQAQRRWLDALHAGQTDPATVQALKADLTAARLAAHALFVAAMRECEVVARSLRHRPRPHVEEPGVGSWP